MGAKGAEQRGQALVEFIIFLPFMLMLYTVVVMLADAINGSINQQKASRGYFYLRVQNSAAVSRPFQPGGDKSIYQNWTTFGQFFVGWADYLEGVQPVYPCYRLNLPFGGAQTDACAEAYQQKTTQFIRVGTVYGICGATYARSNNLDYAEQPITGGVSANLLDTVLAESSCFIKAQ